MAAQGHTGAGGRAAGVVVQEVRGREGLVLYIHGGERPANAVRPQACGGGRWWGGAASGVVMVMAMVMAVERGGDGRGGRAVERCRGVAVLCWCGGDGQAKQTAPVRSTPKTGQDKTARESPSARAPVRPPSPTTSRAACHVSLTTPRLSSPLLCSQPPCSPGLLARPAPPAMAPSQPAPAQPSIHHRHHAVCV